MIQTVEFSVPSMDQSRLALDLSNVLNAIKGVAEIRCDFSAHTVSVDYDDYYTDPRVLLGSIRQSGYQADSSTGTS